MCKGVKTYKDIMIYIDNKESNSLRLIFTLNIALVAYVIVPERSKGTDLRSVVHKHARVRTPSMTSVYIAIFKKSLTYMLHNHVCHKPLYYPMIYDSTI